MIVKEITASQLQEMIQVGSNYLSQNVDHVNSLNVFPVPDGDTGTNMSLSMKTGAKAVADTDKTTVGEVASVLAEGLLMGARGNSGVILSQLFRGFSKAVKDKETITAKDLADAFRNGVETAYQAVMKPVEGTILTVARGAATQVIRAVKNTDDVVSVMHAAISGAKESLNQTPEMLPVLKEVGVVDSGGQGLIYIYEGFLASLIGKFEKLTDFVPTPAFMTQMVDVEHHRAVANHIASEDIQFGYCTEIMICLKEGKTTEEQFNYESFSNYLDGLGDSLLVVNDEKIVKVHVHTEMPGEVMNYGQKFGSLVNVKVDNMRLQHNTVVEKESAQTRVYSVQEKVSSAVIAVAAGKGLKDLFLSLGVQVVLSGGQTMNPSTDDILKAIQEANAEELIILPNNKNIWMSAKSAAEVSKIPVAVIETGTIPQGIAAMLAYNPELKLEKNQKYMSRAATEIVSAQVTKAIRDTIIDGVEVHQGEYIGMVEGVIVVSNSEIIETSVMTLEKMIMDETEIITILVGEDGNYEETNLIVNHIEESHPEIQVEVHQGDQPVYPYFFSSE
ncbi:MAG: DAK2 domain-containing protein [Lactobacillales bacterium]|nr:DAK2 domain-containing protein [Lactobacillales bacterium]